MRTHIPESQTKIGLRHVSSTHATSGLYSHPFRNPLHSWPFANRLLVYMQTANQVLKRVPPPAVEECVSSLRHDRCL